MLVYIVHCAWDTPNVYSSVEDVVDELRALGCDDPEEIVRWGYR
jgi:hypothetical protein